MAYCRFSSDNWKSDLYIWMGFHGIEVYVASNRYVFDPKYPLPNFDEYEDFVQYRWDNRQALDRAKSIPIQLPYAGETFLYDTGKEAAEFVRELSELGYHVPDGVIEALEEENE